MAGRLPRGGKPPEQLRRRNAPEAWTVLPADGSTAAAPDWPIGVPSADESKLWVRLWATPISAWWRDQRIEPHIVATYVRLALEKPSHASVLSLARELGLTPASLQRMRLVVEHPEPKSTTAKPAADPYAHKRGRQKP